MSVVVVISQHLLNVFVQLANKRGLQKNVLYFCYFCKSTFSGAIREWDPLYHHIKQVLLFGESESKIRLNT
jgi:hypothetical protein